VIRICHIITDLDAGGAERALINVISRLDPSRFRNEVISLIKPGIFESDLRVRGVPLISLDMPRGRPTLSGFFKAVSYLRQSRPTIVQTWLYHADLLGSFAHYFTPCARLLWNVRCSDNASAPASTHLRWITNLLARMSAKPDAVIVNSTRGRLFHDEIGYRPRRWIEIPNGVDIQRFCPRAHQRDELRSFLGIRTKGPVIGLVARYDPVKDHATFLQAAVRFVKNYPDSSFVLCGIDCDHRNKALNRLIFQTGLSEHITLLGRRTDMELIYPAFDLVTLCSAFGEGFPNVLIEAMACGVPCVATDVGGCREIIEDEDFIVQPRDPDALVRAWESVLAAPIGVLARKSRASACERYGIERICELYESVYLDLTHATRSSEGQGSP
jgi:glycosyltransferase involved in cell wall biosynthesis